MRIRGSTIAVTGGCGFIGSHLVEALLAAGAAEVRVIDNLDAGAEENLDAVRADPRLSLLAADLRRAESLAPVAGCQAVVHLAAVKHSPARDQPELLLSTNLEASYRLFRRAVEAGVERLVFASSVYVYGTERPGPFGEDDPLLAANLYGATKVAAEALLRAATAGSATRSTALRYFFVYGPRLYRQNYASSLVPRSLRRILAGRPPEVFGDGRQVFDYIYIDDAVAATLAALEHPDPGRAYNVCTGRGVAVLEVVDALLALAGSDLRPVFAPADESHRTVRTGRPDRMIEQLGVTPRVPLATGLRRSIDWWRAHQPPTD